MGNQGFYKAYYYFQWKKQIYSDPRKCLQSSLYPTLILPNYFHPLTLAPPLLAHFFIYCFQLNLSVFVLSYPNQSYFVTHLLPFQGLYFIKLFLVSYSFCKEEQVAQVLYFKFVFKKEIATGFQRVQKKEKNFNCCFKQIKRYLN